MKSYFWQWFYYCKKGFSQSSQIMGVMKKFVKKFFLFILMIFMNLFCSKFDEDHKFNNKDLLVFSKKKFF
jgi:hypothetical protein